MSDKRYIKLSKTMSFFLRHRPEEAGLVLDEEGMVPTKALIRALNKRRSFEWVTERDIHHVVDSSDKKRFHIKEDKEDKEDKEGAKGDQGDRIGARYGHNRKIREVKAGKPVDPPDVLYHGTPRRVVASIMKEGLLPQGRQFVHLSVDVETAQKVGGRRDKRPVILTIRARDAQAVGIEFYAPTAETYLARKIPPKYIELKQK